MHEVRLTEAEAEARRLENEERLKRVSTGLPSSSGVESVLLSSAAPDDILPRFVAWADERMYTAVVA